jgi:GAF domain-containing protein
MPNDLHLQKLLDITREMAEMRTLNPLLVYLVEVACELFRAELGHVILVQADGTLDFRAAARRNEQPVEEPFTDISRSILDRAIEGREPVVVADAVADQAFQTSSSVHGLKLRSVMIAPLLAHGMVLGAIYLENRSLKSLFSEDDLRFLQVLANQAAVAIENAMLNEKLEQRVEARTGELKQAQTALLAANERLLTLQQVDVELSRQLDLSYVLDISMNAAIRLSGADAGMIGLLEDDQVRIVKATGYYQERVGTLVWNERSITRRVLKSRQPELVQDVGVDQDYVRIIPETCAQMTFPLISHERLVGILNLETQHEGYFTTEAFEFLKLLAARIAIALRNAELYQIERQRHAGESTLRQAARVLSETLDFSEVMSRIMDQMRSVVPCDTVSIQRLWGEHLEIVACHGFEDPEQVIGQTFSIVDNQVVNYLVNTHQPIQIEDAAAHPYFADYLAANPDIKFRTWLGVPLVVRDRFIGQITLDRWTVKPYTPDEIDLALAFAHHAAIALENADLYRQQEIHTRALEQTISEREQLIEELDAFAHTVAHDLKNPLGLVVGYAEMLLSDEFDQITEERLRFTLNMIAQGADKMNNIIQALLLLAGVRKTESVKVRSLDMGAIVDEVHHRLLYLIDRYHAEVIAPQEWPVALGYAPWIEEVWANYLSNALKYGGQPPHVELGAAVQEDGFVHFWVRDNGRGLTASEQVEVFTPFTRLSQIEVEGHGLGLSIVQRIVEKLGGRVTVESTIGQGSVFGFTLPGGEQNVTD